MDVFTLLIKLISSLDKLSIFESKLNNQLMDQHLGEELKPSIKLKLRTLEELIFHWRISSTCLCLSVRYHILIATDCAVISDPRALHEILTLSFQFKFTAESYNFTYFEDLQSRDAKTPTLVNVVAKTYRNLAL